jgi:hypothetical protein
MGDRLEAVAAMSVWDDATEDELEAAREAYLPSDPKSPDYVGSRPPPSHERKEHMEISVPAHSQEIVLFSGDPAEKMRQMQETAMIIAEPVRQRHTVKIGQGEHVRVEGWTMLGALLGVYPITVWTRRLTEPDGWEARVEARTRSGQLVGAAEAQCARDENIWSLEPIGKGGAKLDARDDYALRSMAQTRATSKALRQPLGFVITLAGFDPTPAEEMPIAGTDFEPPSLEGRRRLMFHLRDKLIKADKLDEATFNAQVFDDYGKRASQLSAEQTSAVIGRLNKAIDKHGLGET